jgi:hypothetical protein
MAQRWQIDVDQALQHAEIARDLPDMSAIWPEVFRGPPKARRTSTKTSTAASSARGTVAG